LNGFFYGKVQINSNAGYSVCIFLVSKKFRIVLRNVAITAGFTLVLWLVALSEGWGYQILGTKAERVVISRGVYIHEEVVVAHVNISLNPILFPVNRISGEQTIVADFVGYVPLHHWEPPSKPESPTHIDRAANIADFHEIAEIMAIGEVWENLPVYFSFGLFVVYATGALAERVAGSKNQETSTNAENG
jgi:hypothetical protein